ncbi:MAG: membrane protein insertion efficiency factor YidD [Ezakiella sp.]|nr:membrane protein insertion efficiency factor YidD [Ezakiella sp.]MDD7762037.1 membrane protein insertion efficiency factor YidD [Bacillota bacterium]MDY3946959.1 membrane protein insertion efficiency factor YidD [Ezakiella sp.]
MRYIAIKLILFYQKYISKYVFPGAHCRFTPTCSQYALEAFKKYNFFKASFLSLKRILRCNPFCEGGYDPLP